MILKPRFLCRFSSLAFSTAGSVWTGGTLARWRAARSFFFFLVSFSGQSVLSFSNISTGFLDGSESCQESQIRIYLSRCSNQVKGFFHGISSTGDQPCSTNGSRSGHSPSTMDQTISSWSFSLTNGSCWCGRHVNAVADKGQNFYQTIWNKIGMWFVGKVPNLVMRDELSSPKFSLLGL